jgi:hypothetical protein
MVRQTFEVRPTPEGSIEDKPFQLVIGGAPNSITTIGMTADDVCTLRESTRWSLLGPLLERYLLDITDVISGAVETGKRPDPTLDRTKFDAYGNPR